MWTLSFSFFALFRLHTDLFFIEKHTLPASSIQSPVSQFSIICGKGKNQSEEVQYELPMTVGSVQ